MNRNFARHAAAALAAAAIVALTYTAGFAAGNNAAEVAKLNQTIDLLTKARATLDSVRLRQGYSNVEAAKLSVDKAMTETQKAVVANGG